MNEELKKAIITVIEAGLIVKAKNGGTVYLQDGQFRHESSWKTIYKCKDEEDLLNSFSWDVR